MTLCAAQATIGMSVRSAVHRGRRASGFRICSHAPDPGRGFTSRRFRLSRQIQAPIAHYAPHNPALFDELPLIDCTPVKCAHSEETVNRGGSPSLPHALTDAADDRHRASHSRPFFELRPPRPVRLPTAPPPRLS